MAKKRNLKTSLVMSLFLLAIVSTAGAEIIYVDADASTGGDGQTWGTAYKYLQDGLGAGVSGDQIWVADGIYKPDANTGNPTGTGDRFATFQLKNGVAIYAGFAGGQSSLDERDWQTNETILSGDLNGDDGPDFANNYDNSYHVVTGSGTNATAVLDGFTITAGNANQNYPSTYAYGGGMYNNNGSPTITNCTFNGNWAKWGGGMDSEYSSPTVTNCTFSGNSAIWGGGMENNFDGSNPTVTNCTFSGNSAREDGGGMVNLSNSNPTVTNCTFNGNSAKWGGGMSNWTSAPTLANCTFTGNSASEDGGGMENYDGGSPTLTNCILWGNTAPSGSQIYNDGTSSSATVSYSDVQGGWPGTANTNEIPLFVDSAIGDYHLKSQAGRWDSNSQSWVKDDVTSPCIDRGDPDSDWRVELWPHGTRTNMGAYGGTPQASMSLSDVGNIADLNADNSVNFGDFASLVGIWQVEGLLIPQDLDRDGTVGTNDLAVLSDNWLAEVKKASPLPLAHWKLDETEGTIAYDSIGSNDGTLNGDPNWQPTTGKVDGALKFNGTDNYISTDFVLNPVSGSFSVFAWIKGGAPGQVIISQTDRIVGRFLHLGSTWLGTDPLEGRLVTELMNPQFSPLESESIITDGQWHHIGLVYTDALYRHLYVDGVEVAKDTDFVAGVQSTGGLYISAGKDLDVTSFFSGLIDDVRIYNVALSAKEIEELAR